MYVENWVILAAILLNSAMTIFLLRILHQFIMAGFEELVEELPPAIGEAVEGIEIGGNMEGMTPVQVAFANVIQSFATSLMDQPPQIEATVTAKGDDGKYVKKNQ